MPKEIKLISQVIFPMIVIQKALVLFMLLQSTVIDATFIIQELYENPLSHFVTPDPICNNIFWYFGTRYKSA